VSEVVGISGEKKEKKRKKKKKKKRVLTVSFLPGTVNAV